MRWNDDEIETSLKAVGSLQRCINIKTPLLLFDFEMFILLFHFNRDLKFNRAWAFSLAFYMAWKHRLSHKKADLTEELRLF